MAYWLMKSEPSSYSWDDLVHDGGTEWDGVRNNAARLHLKAMKKGDEAFFYASMTDKAVVGIMRITREAQPDPKDPDWVSVRVEPVRSITPVTLKDTVRLGDEVRVVGFPWGRRLTVVSGIVSQIAGADGETATTGAARMIDASVSYGASGGGVFDAPTGALVGIVEGYRTARITLQTVPEKTVDVPVPGETTVIPAATIRSFLVGAGLSPP